MKLAWIENDCVRDICHGDPNECYHPDVAKFYDTEVPDDAVNGDGWIDGQLVKPVVPDVAAIEPTPRTWTALDIRANITLSERVKWDNDELPEIKTAKLEMAVPKELADTTEVLELLVAVNAISQASMSKVLA